MNTAVDNWEVRQCQHCGAHHTGVCPKVKSVEYYPDGTVKRVEYHGEQWNAVEMIRVGPALSDSAFTMPTSEDLARLVQEIGQ